MLFNSIDFFVFFAIIFICYWSLCENIKLQNLLILIASIIFYGWWDWRFLFLILFSSIVDFSIGLLLEKEKSNTKRKYLLGLSVFVNLGFLFYFKYCNFFISSLVESTNLLKSTPL